jgi:hypothetical protein
MLMARQHFFSADNLDLGFTDLEQHRIDLKDKDPVFSPQFRLLAEHLKLIQENVAGWLQAGIIERSRLPYNSPIFCGPKICFGLPKSERFKFFRSIRSVDHRRVSGDCREGREQGVLGARLQQRVLAIRTTSFRSPVHGLHHPREGAVPLENLPARPDGSTSEFFEVDGRVVSGRGERVDIYR